METQGLLLFSFWKEKTMQMFDRFVLETPWAKTILGKTIDKFAKSKGVNTTTVIDEVSVRSFDNNENVIIHINTTVAVPKKDIDKVLKKVL